MASVYIHNWIRTKILELSGETYCYIDTYNDDHDNIICIKYYDIDKGDDIAFGKSTVIRYPYLQVMVRDTSHETAYTRMEAIRALLSPYSYQVLKMFAKGDIHPLGLDERNRTRLTLNFEIQLVEGNTITT